jgi:membrane fusion protein (multidrug efflux system)
MRPSSYLRSIRRSSAPRALGVLLLCLSIAACGTNDGQAASPGGGPGGGPARGPNAPTPVEIATVERTSLARSSMVSGQLSALRTVGVTSQVPGALLEVHAEEGTRVARGQVIAELDSRELTAQVGAAEAAVAFARSTFARSESLQRSQVITAAEFERDRAALASAEASLSQLRTRLGFTRIISPIDGVVTERFVQTGDIVGGQTRIYTISDVSTLVTRLPVSELEVPLLRQGARVPIHVDALGRSVDGVIRRIFPAADSVNRLVPVEVAISGNAVPGLRPGYTVRATLQLDERDGVLVVPSVAVVGAAGAQSVYLVRDGRAERRRVRVGADLDGRTEVIEGLAFGDSVVTTGNALLRDGALLRIVDPLAPEPPSRDRARTVPTPRARP